MTPFEKAELFSNYLSEMFPGRFDSTIKPYLKLKSASVDPSDPSLARLIYTLHIHPSLCNGGANLHGGAVALIFDMCTSMAIGCVAREGFWDSGHVSRSLNCTYLRPAAEGTDVSVEVETVHLGKKMALTRGVIRNGQGKVCYTCEHDKASLGPSL
ncbi:Thioesterase/thiol ester dehydrase-isomerase [Aulographum hederae CBS 113979]|uniref:Thioesterase/thiol ester dehydrase-isomerase n=1 Tax=Aulographum hederae CBS 113979 TaxID=1176131 RepID=A0A6G1GTH4_9PEZI|nr:Thioesterase/thiol ester dehydrase-isomerase [Aulographum hederae CBS 113979]